MIRYVIHVSVFLDQKTVGILQSQFQTAQNVFSSSVFLPTVYHFVLIFASFTGQNVSNNIILEKFCFKIIIYRQEKVVIGNPGI